MQIDVKKVKSKITVALVANVAQWLLVALMAFTAFALVLSSFDTPLKLRVFSVNSGSMEPAIKVGSLVFVRPADKYYESDVITFAGRGDPKNTTTHRIVQVSEDIDLGYTGYVTKGDANEDPDPGFVRQERVLGKVVFKLPLLGYIVAASKTQLGFTFLVVIPATILIYSEIKNIGKEVKAILDEKKEKDKAEAKPEEPKKKPATKKTTKKKTTPKKKKEVKK